MSGAPSFRAVLPAVPLALLLLLLLFPAVVSARDDSASSLYKHGKAAEAREDYDTAFNDYQKAVARNPGEEHYKVALDRVRVTAASAHVDKGRKLLKAGDTAGALGEFLHAAEIDPSNEAAQQEIALARQKQGEVVQPSESGIPKPAGTEAEIESIGGPAQLKPLSNEPLTLHMTEDAKVIYQAIGKAAGINVLFDPDYNSKRVQVDLNNVSLLDALRIVGTMTSTFWRPITANAIFVAQNTRAKRTELDEQAVQTFYLTNAWQQNDLNDVQTALRNVLPNAKVYGVASQNAIVMRGTPDKLLLAEKLVDDLDKPRSEVVVDIAVMEVSRNFERTLGIELAQQRRHGSADSSIRALPLLVHDNNNWNDHHDHKPHALRPGPSEGLRLRGYGGLGHAQSAAQRLQHQGSAKPAHPRHRRPESHDEDRLQDPHRHRLVPDRRSYGPGQLAGQHSVPVRGRWRQHRDDAHSSL